MLVLGDPIRDQEFLTSVEALGYTHVLHNYSFPGDLAEHLDGLDAQIFAFGNRILSIGGQGSCRFLSQSANIRSEMQVGSGLVASHHRVSLMASASADFAVPFSSAATIYTFGSNARGTALAVSLVNLWPRWQLDILATNSLQRRAARERALTILGYVPATRLPVAANFRRNLDSIEETVDNISRQARAAALGCAMIEINVNIPEFDEQSYRATMTACLREADEARQQSVDGEMERFMRNTIRDRESTAITTLNRNLDKIIRTLRALSAAGLTARHQYDDGFAPSSLTAAFKGFENLELEGVYFGSTFRRLSHKIVLPFAYVYLKFDTANSGFSLKLKVKVPQLQILDDDGNELTWITHPNSNNREMCLGTVGNMQAAEAVPMLRQLLAAPNLDSAFSTGIRAYVVEEAESPRRSGWSTEHAERETAWSVIPDPVPTPQTATG